MFLYASGAGTQEELFRKIDNLQTDSVHYPRIYPVDNTNISISGAGGIVVPRVLNDVPLRLVGSGCGNA